MKTNKDKFTNELSDKVIRRARSTDLEQIENLYDLVARESDGLARRPDEISLAFIQHIFSASSTHGLFLVLENQDSGLIDGAIHAHGSDVQNLRHIFGHLTLLIRPKLQGQGLGKSLFKTFLSMLQQDFPQVYRVELRARSSNQAALGLYKSLGFIQEGIFRARIRDRYGKLEDGIPMVWFNPGFDAELTALPLSISPEFFG